MSSFDCAFSTFGTLDTVFVPKQGISPAQVLDTSHHPTEESQSHPSHVINATKIGEAVLIVSTRPVGMITNTGRARETQHSALVSAYGPFCLYYCNILCMTQEGQEAHHPAVLTDCRTDGCAFSLCTVVRHCVDNTDICTDRAVL